MAHLSINLLGPLQIYRDNHPITDLFRTEKEQALLAYLLIEKGRPHSREALAEMLWPERTEGIARTNLRQALSGVRHAIVTGSLFQPFLTITNKTIQFNTECEYSLDTDKFHQLVEYTKSHKHNEKDGCPICIEKLQDAVRLYRGPFLSNITNTDSLTFREWLTIYREQYFRQLLEAIRKLSEYYKTLGDFDKALRYARQLVNLDALDESSHRQLILILGMQGNRSAAIEQYQACCKILSEELGVSASRETQDLYEKIKAGMLSGIKQSNLLTSFTPTQLTMFFGRDNEMERFKRCFSNPTCRLLTVVGIAGSGKTRLVLQVVPRHMDEFPDGAWLVSLEKVRTKELLISSIANAMSLQFSGQYPPLVQLKNKLAPLKALLVLDHFDHLVTETNTLLELLKDSPGLKIILTSREHLNYQSECLFELRGLPYPETELEENPLDFSAYELFINRGLRGRSGFQPKPEDIRHIIRICQLVEGIPLAIELAASRLRDFSCKQIAEILENHFDILETSYKDVQERHRSLYGALNESWEGLSDHEKMVCRRFSLLPNEFAREDAEKIPGLTREELATLANKSLLYQTPFGTYIIPQVFRHFLNKKEVARGDENFLKGYKQFAPGNTLYDPVTNLPRRDVLWERLSYLISRSRRFPQRFAVMILDLFDFGEVNRKYGIPAGDALMRMLASRLSSSLRRNDCIARMDSDEFIFLLEDIITLDSAHIVARKILQTLEEPFEIEGQQISIKGSLGISLYPENGLEAHPLVKKAWIAMEKAAEDGEPYEFYPVQPVEGVVAGAVN